MVGVADVIESVFVDGFLCFYEVCEFGAVFIKLRYVIIEGVYTDGKQGTGHGTERGFCLQFSINGVMRDVTAPRSVVVPLDVVLLGGSGFACQQDVVRNVRVTAFHVTAIDNVRLIIVELIVEIGTVVSEGVFAVVLVIQCLQRLEIDAVKTSLQCDGFEGKRVPAGVYHDLNVIVVNDGHRADVGEICRFLSGDCEVDSV